ncbi:MAG: DUF971 domain-containing protein [Verrucomicrobiae bacterium]|nr:DUF971 domain-containing protein [Verrucomicrobiae bacterium]
MRPQRIERINQFLAIVWDDGRETVVELEKLRRACPCAQCKGEVNILVSAPARPGTYTPASFELCGWQFVGGYGIQPQWGDGHASGIYSFEYLRQLEGVS